MVRMDPDYRYRQAEQEIAQRIRAGEWAYGTQLPAREVLAAELGFGIRTTRRAVDALADPARPGGPMLLKLPGSGTWVIWRETGQGTNREHGNPP